jgi:hypothetical protein
VWLESTTQKDPEDFPYLIFHFSFFIAGDKFHVNADDANRAIVGNMVKQIRSSVEGSAMANEKWKIRYGKSFLLPA